MNSFLIVSMGSSGSRFLAELLNRSTHLDVTHEGNKYRHRTPEGIERANEWYKERKATAKANGQTYGDVNSHMRYSLPHYDMENKAIILRDWREILLSWTSHWSQGGQDWNRAKAEIERRAWMDHVQRTIQCFERYLSAGYPVIDFHLMTTNLMHLQMILWRFGATDVKVTNEDISQKVNSHNQGRLTNYEDIPRSIREPFDRITAVFNEKYILQHGNYKR